MSEEPPRSSNRKLMLQPEHLITGVIALAGLLGAVNYFIGSRYLDAKAQTLGFVGDIADPPFQRVVAIGFSVSNDTSEAYTAAFEGLGLLLLTALVISAIVSERVTRWLGGASRYRMQRVTAELLFVLVVSLVVNLALGVGAKVGKKDGEEILKGVQGGCDRCQEYVAGNRHAWGIAALQSKELLIVATKSGTSAFPLTEPLEVLRKRDLTIQAVRPEPAKGEKEKNEKRSS